MTKVRVADTLVPRGFDRNGAVAVELLGSQYVVMAGRSSSSW